MMVIGQSSSSVADTIRLLPVFSRERFGLREAVVVASRSQYSARPFGGVRAVAINLSLAVSACLMAFGLVSPGHGWVAWLALPPLLFSIRVMAPLYAAVCGAVWGVSLFALASLASEAPFAPTLTSLLLLALVPAAYAYFGSLLTQGVGFSALFLGLGWIGVELALRPLSLEYGLLAGTLGGEGALTALVGSVFGYGLVAFLIAFANGLLLTLLSELRFDLSHLWAACGLLQPVGSPVAVSVSCPCSVRVSGHRPRGPPL